MPETIEAPVTVDVLEEILKEDLTCDFCDKPVEWRIIWKGCDHYGLVCGPHKDKQMKQWRTFSLMFNAYCRKCLAPISDCRAIPV